MDRGLSTLKLIIGLFVITLVLTLGILGFYLYSTGQVKINLPFLTPLLSPPASEVVSESGVTFRSEISGLKIESVDNEALKTYLERLGLGSFQDVPFISSPADRLVSLDKITVVFRPFSSLDKDQADGKIQKEEQILVVNDDIFYYAGKLSADDNSAVIPVYVKDEVWQKITDLNFALTEFGLQALFYNLRKPPLSDLQNHYGEFIARLELFEKPIFTATFSKAQLLIFNLQNVLQIGSVKADDIIEGASCTGSKSCGTFETVKRCIGGTRDGQRCYEQNDCPDDPGPPPSTGSCQIAEQTCNPTGVSVQCFTSGSDCVIRSCLGCTVANNCTVTYAGGGGGATPTPTPPSGGCTTGFCAYGIPNCGTNGWANGTGTCDGGICCVGGGGGGGGSSDPCPLDTCPGYCCNYICGQPCIVTADCAKPSSGNPVWCSTTSHTCVNALCPNNTVPGTICGCSGGITCGNPCAGGCINNSTCRFTQAPNGNCAPGAATYCIGDAGDNYHTFNSAYVTPRCTSGDTGNRMLYRVATGQTTNFTLAQIQSTCPRSTIRARAHLVSPDDASCTAINASTSYLSGATFSLTPNVSPGAQTQSGERYVSWNTTTSGSYTLVPTAPAGYDFKNACWTRNPTAPTSGTGLTTDVNITAQDIVTWDLGYTANAWWQARDSDVTAGGFLISQIPTTTCIEPTCYPRLIRNGVGGYPGVALYQTFYDFSTGSSKGQVSSTNWLAETTYQGRRYDYSFFSRQIPTDVTFTEIDSDTINGGFLSSGGTPARGYIWYHRQGDLTINGSVNQVGSRRVILLVEEGNLYINGTIGLQSPGQGFFMAVVGNDADGNKGDILVDASVSHPNDPELQGIFVADSEFRSGAGSNQLHVKGSVTAWEGFLLQRVLSGTANGTAPAELFEYDPTLIFTFPREFFRSRLMWKEVSP